MFLRRLAGILPLLLLISALSFALVRLAPGGPFDRDRAAASEEIERALRARYHLDEPVWRQYLQFLRGAVVGDFGPSLKYRSHEVGDIIAAGFPVSLVLGGLAFLFALGVGLPMGFAGAVWRGRWVDWLMAFLGLLAVCVPAFVAGPLLALQFALHREWFPVALWGGGMHLVLPVVTLGIYQAGRVSRLLREGMATTLRSAYVRAARAKGLSEGRVLLRHAFPLGAVPVVTYSGPLLADLLTGSFVVENLFQLPGVGTLTVNSALNRDYPLIVALVLLYAVLLLFLNLASDLAHAWIDPRVRHATR